MPVQPVEFRYAARSDVGLTRQNNQDSGYAGPNLLVLADGMGGPAGGDIASSVALAHLVPLDGENHAADKMLPLLRDALMAAHDELTERSSRDAELKGLGTTCIAIMLSGNKLAMVHLGDSRAYVLRNDTFSQVTTDHSFVQYLVDTGQITPEEAENHPQRNVVLRILGDSQMDVTPDETVREAVVGDRWLLCSDGLSGVVAPETIGHTLASISDLDECAEELIKLALLAGGPDNITVVIADVVQSGDGMTVPQVVGAAAVDRNAPSRGGQGAAARAAALSPKAPAEKDDEEPVEQREPVKWWKPALAVVAALAVAVGGWLGYLWTQTQYYVIGEDDSVVIYQGIPQNLGPWAFSHPLEVTDVKLKALPQVDRERLQEPVVRSSREGIDEYVAQLAANARVGAKDDAQSGAQSGAKKTTSTTTPKPSTTPKPTTTPKPSSTPKPTAAPSTSAGTGGD